MKRIAIIGGGASGLMAAVRAARAGAAVTLFESSERVGDSVRRSGNGRCNFSNARAAASFYRNAAFVEETFAAVPPEDVWDFWAELGLAWREEGEGRLYPLANKATSVLDVLRFAIDDAGVSVRCSTEVSRIAVADGGVVAICPNGSALPFDGAVVACGGAVARRMLPSGFAFEPAIPVLGPIDTERQALRGLDKVRLKGSATCIPPASSGRPPIVEEGEIMFRERGVSGIAVFDLSRFARPGDTIRIDALPSLPEAEAARLLEARLSGLGGRPAVGFLAGIVLPSVARAMLRAAGIDPELPLDARDVPAAAHALTCFDLTVEGIGDAAQCQVRRGGFSVSGFDPSTLASLEHPAIHVVGEALDIDAPCGGYNLHWAWASGIAAADHAAGGE